MPFGVQLPDNMESSIESTGNSSDSQSGGAGTVPAPEIVTKDARPAEITETGTPQPAPTRQQLEQALTDLDKLERFRFGGREWSPKELKSATMLQSDYTRKTQELTETRKYVDNFSVDLQTVLKDPAAWGQFQKVYPKEFVAIAKEILDNRVREAAPQQNADPSERPDPYAKRFERIEGVLGNWEKAQHQAEVEKTEAWLDNQFDTLSKKFPRAQSEVVSARAEAAHKNGIEITDKVLEKLFRQNHEETQAAWEKHYKEKVDQQLKAGSKAKDVGPGGATPSAAPVVPKTMKEARRALDEHLEGAR